MAGKHNIWTERELRGVYKEYLAGAHPSALAKRRGYLSAELLFMFAFRQWPLRGRAARVIMPKRVSNDLIQAMHADYMMGRSIAEVARHYSRSRRSVRDLFASRGLRIRDFTGCPNKGCGGRFEAVSPKSDQDIDELIASSTRMIIPLELKNDWSKWTMERRGEFIARMRAHLNDPKDRPDLPFSSNVIPFDYTTESAWEIIRRRNAGRSSWTWETKLNIISQGVIWDGRLWFWARRMPAYYEGIKWTPGHGRPGLHQTLWESVHGPIPDLGVVRLIDGNPNNLDPSNLTLSDRNELCRENQARSLSRKSRELTSILLHRHQTNTSHAHPDLNEIRARRRSI